MERPAFHHGPNAELSRAGTNFKQSTDGNSISLKADSKTLI